MLVDCLAVVCGLPAADPELLILCLLACPAPPELLLPGGLLVAFTAAAAGVALLATADAGAADPKDGMAAWAAVKVVSAAAGGCSAGVCVSAGTSSTVGRTGTGWQYVLLSFTSNPAYM
jgi:hypothetical protein